MSEGFVACMTILVLAVGGVAAWAAGFIILIKMHEEDDICPHSKDSKD